MSQESLAGKMEVLESKVKKLVENHYYLKESLKDAQNENEVLRAQLDFKNEELKNFQNQFKISKLANVVAEDNKYSAEFKQKINEYIKEVEKTLAYLNRA